MNHIMMRMNIIPVLTVRMFVGMNRHNAISVFIRGLLIIFVTDIQKIHVLIMQQYIVKEGNMYGVRNSKNGNMTDEAGTDR